MNNPRLPVPTPPLQRGESVANPLPTRRVWRLSKADRVVECEFSQHVSGYELRVYLGSELFYRRVDTLLTAAEAQAANLKRALLADGWIAG